MNFKKYVTKKIENGGLKKKILFIDGGDPRAVEAAQKHQKDGFIEPVLLSKSHLDVKGVKTVTTNGFQHQKEELIQKYLEKRKGKEDRKQAEKVVFDPHIFAMLLLETGEVDGVIGGLEAPTADILRAAFKVIGPQKGVKTISSVMVMEKEGEVYLFGDISVNIEPSKEQLVDIAKNASDFAQTLDLDPKVAFLSFSTSGSAVHPRSTFVKEATDLFNKRYKSLANQAVGEVQFDAAFDEKIRVSKYKNAKTFPGKANVFVFPSLEAGNIGYKIAQRMGGFGAIGPVLTGVNKPVNDLSRGATVEDVYNTAVLTAVQAFGK